MKAVGAGNFQLIRLLPNEKSPQRGANAARPATVHKTTGPAAGSNCRGAAGADRGVVSQSAKVQTRRR
jgi:hypothetical protein